MAFSRVGLILGKDGDFEQDLNATKFLENVTSSSLNSCVTSNYGVYVVFIGVSIFDVGSLRRVPFRVSSTFFTAAFT